MGLAAMHSVNASGTYVKRDKFDKSWQDVVAGLLRHRLKVGSFCLHADHPKPFAHCPPTDSLTAKHRLVPRCCAAAACCVEFVTLVSAQVWCVQ